MAMLGAINDQFLVSELCNQLPIRTIFNLGGVGRGTRECVIPILKDTIQIAQRALDGIFTLPLLDESKLTDCTYCRGYLSRVVRRIDSAKGSLRLALEASQIHLEEETQAVKDDNLLMVFKPRLPIEVQGRVSEALSISEKAKIVREFLRDNPNYFSGEIRMDLSGLGLTLIPKELIDYFPKLQELNLSHNQISVISDAIGALGNLRSLYLFNNQISIIPQAIGKLGNLRELDLSCNQISVISDAIGELVNLRALHLWNNQISVIPDAIGKLGNLRELDLSHNQISAIPDAIGKLGDLDWLKLPYNQISVFPEAIGKLGNLRELNLSHNQISAIPDAIGKLVNLNHLNLEYNPIKTIPGFFASFGGVFLFDAIPAPAASAITDGA